MGRKTRAPIRCSSGHFVAHRPSASPTQRALPVSCCEAAKGFASLAVASGDFDPQKLLSVLHDHGVRFVLIGGMAAVLHGDVGVTVDLDVVPERHVG